MPESVDQIRETDTKPAVSAVLNYVPLINLALYQNSIPVVYELKLTNQSGGDLENLECAFSSSTDFILEKTIPVNLLKSGEELPLHDLGVELNYQQLSSISEMMKGKLNLEIRHQDHVLFRKDYDLTAFAADQWLGLEVIPELICSFVTPNLEVVNHLLTVVAEELKKATGSASIEGYQGDKHRVYEICAAIYRAIHSWGITYANPASSFGTPGQRIRFADTIFKFRIGTCLDTTLLFASVMEQCGLHPVIMLQEGHAYIGCHLVNRYFPDVCLDDLQMIRKLTDLDEFLVLETTMVTGDATFSTAEAAARSSHLNIDRDFRCAIDVVRARYSGIRPLPLKRSAEGIEFEEPKRRAEELGEEHKRTLQQNVDLSKFQDTEQRSGRIARWTQKLLDLSLRNRLLNVRDTKYVIPIACPDITVLEDRLAANESFSLNPLSNLLGEKDLHDLALLRNSEIKTEIKVLLENEFQQKRLWTLLTPAEMSKRMTALYRQGKTDLEEGGVNTLFAAIGFLEWKVSPRDEKSYLAPILLVPIRLFRKSIVEGIRISRIDEDTMINETLLELLRSQYNLNVPGMGPQQQLPTDQSGVDVGLVMQIFRQTIKDMPGWEVREEVRLGHFSFGKIVMWKDMTARADVLCRNPLVKHLIEGGGLFDDGIEVFPPEEIGQHLDLANLYCPMSADSSQLTAVLYSTMGKNFVLHGPPGTGKSQTITNIIAQNLAMGRRVLFVSEKKAALEVVHKRLSAIGLRPFCLELHSNKSGKNEVLAQFAEALNVPELQESKQWPQVIEELQKVREDLNSYVKELHRQYPNGMSAYDCFSRLFSPGAQDDLLDISCLTQTGKEYNELLQLVSDLAHAYEVLDPGDSEPLAWLNPAEWSPVYEKNLISSLRKLRDAADQLQQSHAAFCRSSGLPESERISMVYQMACLAAKLREIPDIPESLLNDSITENAQYLALFSQTAQAVSELRKKLKNYNLEQLRSLDLEGIQTRIRMNEQSFFLFRMLKNNALLKELDGLKKSGGLKLTVNELSSAIPDFMRWEENIQRYESMLGKAKSLLGKIWQDEATDWAKLAPIIDSVRKLLEIVQLISGRNAETYEQCLIQLRKVLPDAARHFAQETEAYREINDFLLAWDNYQKELPAFSAFATEDITKEDVLSRVSGKLDAALAHTSGLRNMMRYKLFRIRGNTPECGLQKFISALESGTVAPQDASHIFELSYAREMLNQILERSSILSLFNGLDQAQRIRRFRELDDLYTKLAEKIVPAKLAASLPRRRSGPCPEGTELGLLKRECEKKARQRPVRQLLSDIPTVAARLKPCFLMSPLSVAQYLPADSAPFDLIVFDEASQIPVWDAIGVIARGKQLIVVGDPKQMPPTNFFQKGDSAETDAETEELEDMESILDECLAAGVYSSYLNWHYRSRHEALISFSNHYYYSDRLFTFPAAHDSGRLGVRFQFVPDAVYDRCSTRTNRKEAEALVGYIFRQLEKNAASPRSIGVVTFSEAQKNLIEDLLETERSGHPELDSYFSDQNEEPLFVKNLENVQGDERDVILFSICYAPDADGRFSMNFGPLNRRGGERRLNVAITRAKEQIVVFSSIHAPQIELSRTNAVGAAHLKFFLDYAEKGFRIQNDTARGSESDNLAGLIAAFLTEHGFSVERNFGCSGYRISLAVRNPDHPDEFLLGIECDGPSYAAQKTTRDRDHLRYSVLRSLGWHIFQAWTVDWCFDRERSQNKLLEFIEQAKTESPAVMQKPETAEPEVKVPEVEAPEPAPVQDNPPSAQVNKNIQSYIPAVITCSCPQEQFYEFASRPLLRQQMVEVIQQEAPIYERLLKKRITRAWHFDRAGDRIQAVLNSCLPQDLPTTCVGEEKVYWNRGQDPAQYRGIRTNGADNKRTIDEIPPEELANAMYEILIDFSSCETDTLFRETVKIFGLSSVTQKARKYLDFGLKALRNSSRC
jgi:hypothetical protein